MISKCEKSSIIRNYYIELEKLLITYIRASKKASKKINNKVSKKT